jgi:hypothetical protein
MNKVDLPPVAPDTFASRRGFLGLCCALPLLTSRAFARSAPRPAMWVGRMGKASVHLFGQMPLRAGTQWLAPEIEAAFEHSDLLWLENPEYNKSPPDVLAAVQELRRAAAVDAGFSVFNVLSPSDALRLDQVLRDEGFSRDFLTGRPLGDVRQWLSSVADKRTAVDYQTVPEVLFRTRANAARKEVRTEWKDLAEVIRWSDEATADVKRDTVRLALDDVDRARHYDEELNSWLQGTLRFQKDVARANMKAYPALYGRMSTERNARLAQRIHQALSEGRRQFACIGILHLIGPGSLQEQLRRTGVRVTQALMIG